ncbi:MAG: hypothetical protein ABSB35_38915 [Bryobacteraceae bacterium]
MHANSANLAYRSLPTERQQQPDIGCSRAAVESMDKVFAYHADVVDLHLETRRVDEHWVWQIVHGAQGCVSNGRADSLEGAEAEAQLAAGGTDVAWRAVEQ